MADCELAGVNYCNTSSPAAVYYACSGDPLSCQTGNPTVSTPNQVTNPVVAFPVDNNGNLITFPSVASFQASAIGTITFGIGTQSNNTVPGTVTIYVLDSNDNFATEFSALYWPQSFIDSGSNAFYFPDYTGLIPICSDDAFFFCPTSTDNLSAQNAGTSGIFGPTVYFSIDSADSLFSNSGDAVFGTLGGPNDAKTPIPCTNPGTGYQGDCSFDWGLPFFYGRTVFTSIDTKTVNGQPTPPWWAY